MFVVSLPLPSALVNMKGREGAGLSLKALSKHTPSLQGVFNGWAGRLFGLAYHAGVYAGKGPQGMPNLRSFEIKGAWAGMAALSLK